MYFAIRLHLLRGETREADALAEAALTLCSQHGFTFFDAIIQFLQGCSLYRQDREAEGITRMRTGFEAAQSTGMKLMRPMYCALLAEVYGQAGQLDEAWRKLADALDAIEQTGQRYYEAEIFRFKGELHLREQRPNVEQAEAYFQRALSIARHQQAKSWELRAAITLAQLWRDQGRRQEARNLLAPVYGWFTEGFDTADLRNAKGLLDELA
jgi:predicted ATPase